MDTKFIVKKNETVGRYCTASCNLNAGDIIFHEEPFSFGPKSNTYLICLGCHKPLDEITLCEKCGWPVCDSECSKIEIHNKNECQIFSSNGIKYNTESEPSPQLECITVLRTLLECERNNKRWTEEVSIMESHTNERKNNKEFWDAEQVNVVNFLIDKCKLRNRFKKETVQTICGILEVNCFEIITENNSLRGLYPKLAVFSHNCISNTIHSIIPNNNYKMIFRTTVPVSEGDELYSSYTKSTDPTLLRRPKLLETKYFHCQCQRCSDPTELGTHLNTLKCTKCDNGIVMTTNPLDNNASWKCDHCDYAVTAVGVQKIYQILENEIEELRMLPFTSEKVEAAEKLLKKYKSFLHPRHAFRLDISHELINLYGRVEGYTMELLPDILLMRKIDFCQTLLDTYNVIEPGLTRLRATVLYEYHAALMLVKRSEFESKVINLEKFKDEMRKVANMLEESGKILSLEPEGTIEKMIGATALHSCSQLRGSLELLKESPSQEQK